MHTVATIAYDAVNPFEQAVATEVFGFERPELGVPWYRFLICAEEPRPIRTSIGILLTTPYSLEHIAEADTVIVPSSRPGIVPVSEALLETTNETIERVATGCGFSSAATFRLHFQRLLHISPQAYRNAFHRENRNTHRVRR